MSFKTNVLKNIAKLSAVDIYSLFASFLSSYFNARFLGPLLMGTLQTASLALSYAPLSSLSLPFILRRDLPQLRGEGDEEEALFISAIVFTYGIISSFISALCVFVISFFIHDQTLSYVLVFYSLIILFQGFSSFGNIVTKGLNKYNFLSKISIIAPSLRILGIIGVYYFQIHAILVTLLLISIVEGVIYYIKVPYGYNFKWHFPTLKRMMLAALPLFFINVSSIIFETIDRLVIASFGSFEQVGYYSVGNFISNPLNILVGTTSLVLFTQLNEKYGKNTSAKVIKLQVELPLLIISKFAPVFLLFGTVAIPFLINTFLPKYEEGIVAAQIVIIGIYFYGSSSFASNALFLKNKQKWTAIAFLIIGVLKTALCIFVMKIGLGIEGVAVSTTISYFLYNLILVFLIYYEINEVKNGIINQVKFLAPMLYSIICFFLINYINKMYLFNYSDVFGLLIQFIITFILVIPILIYLYKSIKNNISTIA